ncbi:unnamed protein product [Hanseniaspora opuntiae]
MISKFKDIRYSTFVLLGIVQLYPWNSMLSLSQFMTHDIFKDTTIYAKTYASTMMTVSTITSVIVNYYLSKRQFGFTSRISKGIVWQLVVFVSMAVLICIVGSLKMGITYFIINFLTFVSSFGTSALQNGTMAWSNIYGSEVYSQAVMFGQAVAGVVPSLLPPSKIGVILYFISTILLCLFAYVVFKISKIGRDKDIETPDEIRLLQHDTSAGSDGNKVADTDNSYITALRSKPQSTKDKESIPLIQLYKKVKFNVLSIFTCFVVTLLFPVFAGNTFVSGLPMNNSQFIPLAFLVWNIGDLYGRYIAKPDNFLTKPFFKDPSSGKDQSKKRLFLYSILRVLNVPLFFTCNILNSKVEKGTLIDIWYLLLQFLFGLSNGHCISISFMTMGDNLENEDDNYKASVGGFSLIFVSAGLTIGSLISYMGVYVVDLVYGV